MRSLVEILSLLFIIFICSSLRGQSFQCDGKLLISTVENNTTTISKRTIIPFGPQFFSPIARYYNHSFDALGFNSKDNYIYAIKDSSNAVVRLHSDNSFDTIGIVTIVDTLRAFAGDCSPTGQYFFYEDNLKQMLVYEVVEEFTLIDRINLYWDPESTNSGPFEARIYDIAFDPNNPRIAYTFQSNSEDESMEPEETQGYILSINLDISDPNVGMVTPVSKTTGEMTHAGALLFSERSGLFAFGAKLPGVNPIQRYFFGINPWTGMNGDTRAISPTAIISDGCSCPYSFTFTNNAPQEGSLCSNDIKKFILTISNFSFNEISGVTLTDTFPEGMKIEEIKGDFDGIIDENAGVGTNILKIDQLKIPAKSIVEIQVRVLAVDIPVGYLYNQAFLSNLPGKFGGIYPSDDPLTVGVDGDPSRFVVAPLRIDNISWEITPPKECLIANDAKVLITSSQFIPQQKYEIRLRNKVGWEETTWQVTIDNERSFLLDSLIPGNYQLFYIRAEGGECSLAVKDTTIIIEPPNEQLTAKAHSNHPVCEGESLILRGEVFPGGEIDWRGPLLFASEEKESIILESNPEQSGEYSIRAEYGYCVQHDTIEVLVAPQVKAKITGDSAYCERDELYIYVEGQGDNLQYSWTGPGDLVATEIDISYSSVVPENEGYYEVIVNNGACSDTTGVEITVLPSPTISLPTEITSDYCETLKLEPVITGDPNVKYEWFPKEGLTCNDCPDPTVIPIVQSDYSIKVINDFLCTDSLNVRIVLDKSKILNTPNIFRPLSAFNNDLFLFHPSCVVQKVADFEIYDRWGNKVFSRLEVDQNNPSDFWDGRIGGQIGFPGVYIWKAKVELVDGSFLILNGDITLLR